MYIILLVSHERAQNVYLCWIKYIQTLPALIRNLNLYLKVSPTANLSQELNQEDFTFFNYFLNGFHQMLYASV